MNVEQKSQDLYEALDELRRAAHEIIRNIEGNSLDDVAHDILEGELKTKMDLVTSCAQELDAAIGERVERAQRRAWRADSGV